MAGMAEMAEWQKEWQNDKMAEMDTYVLFMVHADTDDDDDDDDNDNDDTLIFYSIELMWYDLYHVSNFTRNCMYLTYM